MSQRALTIFLLSAGVVFFSRSAFAITARFDQTSSLLPNGDILIAGGQTTNDNTSALTETELLTSTGGVIALSNLPSNLVLSSQTATVLPNGQVFLFGGGNSSGNSSLTEIFDPATNSWTSGPTGAAVVGHTATLLQNGTLLICGGMDSSSNPQSACYLYTTAGGIQAGPTMLDARAFHSATLLSNGDVLMAGGITTGGVYTPTTEIYNPGSNTFGSGPPLIMERAYHTATALGNGQVLIAGGSNNVYTSTTEIELCNSAQCTAFAPGTPMNEAREQFPATLDADGELIVTGGLGSLPAAQNAYPTLQVNGTISYSGTTFTNQTLSLANPVSPTLTLSVNAAGVIVGGTASFPASQITFSSGTLTINAFNVPLSNQGTCIYTSGNTPPWQCGIIQITSLPSLSGTVNCLHGPCSSPINLDPTGTTPVTMSETLGDNTQVSVAISSMVFADAEIYNPSQNTWTLNTSALAGPNPLNLPSGTPPYSFARFGHTSVLTPMDTTEAIGGATWNGTYYTAQTNVLAGIESFTPPTSGPSLPSPRAYHTSTILPSGKIIIAGGQADSSTNTLNTSLIFDPVALTFTPSAPLNVSREFHTATLLPNGNILAAGGANYSTGTLSSAEIYSSTGSAWTETGSMNVPSDYHTATLLPSGNVLIVGGLLNGTTFLNRAEIYYSTSATWVLTTPIPSSLTNGSVGLEKHTATLLQNGNVLVTGGFNAGGALNTAEIYNPSTQIWTAAAAMPVSLYEHTATLLSNGDVLVAGGDSGTGETTTSLIYHPNSNIWSTTSVPLNNARFAQNAVLLPNGGVLVSGGFTASGGAVSSIEIYDPYSQSWTPAGAMPVGRGGHTTTVAPSGTIFDIGGLSTNGGSNYLSTTDSYFFTGSPDLYTLGAPPSTRQPIVNSINYPVLVPSAYVTVAGSNFHDVTEASGGGAASANSDQDKPRMVLQSIDSASSFLIDLSTQIYNIALNPSWSVTNSSITIQLPATQNALPYGWYQLRVAANAQYSPGLLVHAGPPLPTSPAQNLTSIVLSSNSVSWSWSAAGGTFDGYDVYSATDGVFLSTDALTSFIQTGIAPNSAVQLLVAPYNTSGDGPGATSAVTYTFAAVPQSLLISSDTGSSLELSWNPNNNSQGTIYEVSESSDDFVNSFSTPIPTSLLYTSTQATITDLQIDTTYYFRVRAFNANNIPSTGFSNYASTMTVDQVSNLTGSPASTTEIDWNWNSLTLPPGGYFALYNSTSNTLIATTVNSYFADVGLSTNSPRSVQVAAVTSSGQGPLTSTVTVYTDAAIPTSVGPIIFIATSGFTGQWSPNGNPANTLYACTVTGVNLSTTVFTSLTTSSSTALSCDVTGLPLPGSFYQAQVIAINGNGIETNPLSLGTTETLAAAPSNLAITETTAGSISISWSTSTNSALDSYQITYSTDDFITNISTALSFSNGLNQNSLTISNLIGGYTYWIRAQAQNQNGVASLFSNVLSTVTFNYGAPPGTNVYYVYAASDTLLSGTFNNGESMSLQIPPNSLSEDTYISFSTISASPSLCPGTGSGVGISITASPPVEPTNALTLTLSYIPSQVLGLNLTTASLMRVTGTNSCVPVETKINTTSNQLTATLNHISQFELADVTPGTGVDSVVIFPNPFYPSRGNGYVTFKNLPSAARVRLYTLRGELVFEGNAGADGLFDWPGTNRSGRLVGSGVYLVEVDSSGARKIYKVAVER